MNKFDRLIENNTGYSAKNFVLVIATIMVIIIILSFLSIIFIDLFNEDYYIKSDMYAMASIITALAGLIGYLYNRKVKSEQQENDKK